MAMLLTGVSPRAVRVFFDKSISKASLASTINDKTTKTTLLDLKLKRIINQTQWNLLFPTNGKQFLCIEYIVFLINWPSNSNVYINGLYQYQYEVLQRKNNDTNLPSISIKQVFYRRQCVFCLTKNPNVTDTCVTPSVHIPRTRRLFQSMTEMRILTSLDGNGIPVSQTTDNLNPVLY